MDTGGSSCSSSRSSTSPNLARAGAGGSGGPRAATRAKFGLVDRLLAEGKSSPAELKEHGVTRHLLLQYRKHVAVAAAGKMRPNDDDS